MARVSQAEMDALLQRAGGGRLVHMPVAGQTRVPNPDYDPIADDPSEAYLPGKQTIEQWVSPDGYVIQAVRIGPNEWDIVKDTPPDPSKNIRAQKTPDETRADAAIADQKEIEAAKQKRDEEERQSNATTPDEFGVTARETNEERAKRVVDRRNAERQQQQTQATIEATRASTAAASARIQQDASKQTSDDINSAADRALRARQLQLQEEKDARDAKKPDFLNQADTKNQKLGRYDPTTGTTVWEDNPNYDAVKAAAEEQRAQIASQIAQRQITLDEGKQQYTQWFDSNVRTPLMIAQEARAKAEEKRQALEAEERRRQFAADYGLRKATLGQQAGQDAAQNEISLLPYRSGPTWGADISSAINSLGAGGKVNGPDAGAGIHFSDSSFAFDRPDFKKIAAEATKQVLGGLTDYRPSDQQFETADYSGVPPVNTSGMPAYSFGGGGGGGAAPSSTLPPPSPEYTQ